MEWSLHIIRTGKRDWHKAGIFYWNKLFRRYHLCLDKGYTSKFPKECINRLWELNLAYYISIQADKSIKLLNFLGIKNRSNPDFYFSHDENKFYVEAVACASSRNSINYLNLNLSFE